MTRKLEHLKRTSDLSSKTGHWPKNLAFLSKAPQSLSCPDLTSFVQRDTYSLTLGKHFPSTFPCPPALCTDEAEEEGMKRFTWRSADWRRGSHGVLKENLLDIEQSLVFLFLTVVPHLSTGPNNTEPRKYCMFWVLYVWVFSILVVKVIDTNYRKFGV